MTKKVDDYKVIMPTVPMLQNFIRRNRNVLFIGKHGVGKTTLIMEAFKAENLTYKIFNAATMDPFTDFIGIPREQTDSSGSYLEYVKPKDFRDGNVQAIFFDEVNRGHKAVTNQILELVQFRTLNGVPMPNLRFVWAAMNPGEDSLSDVTYDVEPFDQAKMDRFHYIINLPYEPNKDYLVEKYGTHNAKVAIEWWSKLSPDLKNLVSPRRLSYVLDEFAAGGDVTCMLPMSANPKQLLTLLESGSVDDKFKKLVKGLTINSTKEERKELTKFLSDPALFDQVKKDLIPKYIEGSAKCMSEERLFELISSSTKVKNFVVSNPKEFKKELQTLRQVTNDAKLKEECKKALLTLSSYKYSDTSKEPFSFAGTFSDPTKLFSEAEEITQETVEFYTENEIEINDTTDSWGKDVSKKLTSKKIEEMISDIVTRHKADEESGEDKEETLNLLGTNLNLICMNTDNVKSLTKTNIVNILDLIETIYAKVTYWGDLEDPNSLHSVNRLLKRLVDDFGFTVEDLTKRFPASSMVPIDLSTSKDKRNSCYLINVTAKVS